MYRLLSFLFIAALLGTGCSALKQTEDSENGMAQKIDSLQTEEISERDQLKFEFALIEGMKQKVLGNYSKAIAYFYQCLEIDPTAAAPQYQISLINNLLEDEKVALRYGKKAVKNEPDNRWYREHLAQLYLRQNNTKGAIEEYEALLRMGHNRIEYFYDLAQLYQQTKQYEKSIEMLNKLESRVGVNEQVSVLKKILYTRMGEKDKAIEETRKLIQSFPDETRYYGMLAELYASYKEYDKAEEMYDKLFSMDSTNRLGQISLVKYYQSKNQPGKALDQFIRIVDQKDIDFGSKMLIFMNFLDNRTTLRQYQEKMVMALDSLQRSYPDKTEVHTLYADLYLKLNQFKESAEHLEILAHSDKHKPVFWDQLLSIYSYLGNFQKLYEEGQKSLELYQDKPRLYLLTAIGAIQTEHADTAIVILKEGIKKFTDNKEMMIEFYGQLGEAYHQTKNYERSDYYFEKVLEQDPTNLLIANNYSYYLSLRGENLDRALELSKGTLDKEPANPVYLDTYAWVLYKMGRYDKAHKYIEKALKNSTSDDPDLLEHYGDILFKKGKKEKAVEMWKRSLANGNKSEQIRFKIQNKEFPEP